MEMTPLRCHLRCLRCPRHRLYKEWLTADKWDESFYFCKMSYDATPSKKSRSFNSVFCLTRERAGTHPISAAS